MRIAPLVVNAALLLAMASAAVAGPTGQLCFVRAEDMGVANPNPVAIWGEHAGRSKKLVELRGKKQACVKVPLGSWTLEARSARPTDAKSSEPEACRSYPFMVEVRGREPLISVSPLGGGPTNMCGWDFR